MTSVVLTSEKGSVELTSVTTDKDEKCRLEDASTVKAEQCRLLAKVPEAQRAHVADIQETHKANPPKALPIVQLYTALTYFNYVRRWIKNFVMTFVSNPSMPIFYPLDFLFMVTVIPFCTFVMLLTQLSFHVGEKLGLGKTIDNISVQWGSGLTAATWWDPRIFSVESKEIVENAKDALGKANTPVPDDPTSPLARSFNFDIAQTMLLFSAIVYERNQTLVDEGHKIMADIAKNPASATSVRYGNLFKMLKKSEKRIRCQARMWEVEFTSLSELNSFGGPFAGIFWSEKKNFITVVFKGTTPTDYQDFLTDFTWQRTDARAYLFGDVHEGFYTSMFPSVNSARSNQASPYFTIVRAIRETAKKIRAATNQQENVNVWVTGHSLGAALGGLFFTRLLQSPADMGAECELRDGYFFGMPRLGDDDWAAGFNSLMNRPFDRPNTLWRVVNGTDLVTRIPPGYNNPDSGRYISQQNMLNYSHIGEEIHFYADGRKPTSSRNIFSSGNDPIIVERNQPLFKLDVGSLKAIRKSPNLLFNDDPNVHPKDSPIPFLARTMPTCIADHMPTSYFNAMKNARSYFEDSSKSKRA